MCGDAESLNMSPRVTEPAAASEGHAGKQKTKT